MWWKIILCILFPPLGTLFLIVFLIEYLNNDKNKKQYYIILPNQETPVNIIENKLKQISNNYLETPYKEGEYLKSINEMGFFALCYTDDYYMIKILNQEFNHSSIVIEILTQEEFNKKCNQVNDYVSNQNQEFDNAFRVLGLNNNASVDEIKKAFRTLAKKYHPDVNKTPGAETKFKEINEAYKLLKQNLNFT